MVINTLFELLSMGIILPIVTILLKKDFDFLPENFHNLIESLDYVDLVKYLMLGIIFIYIVKNLFIIFYNYQQGLFVRNLQIRVVGDLFEKYVFQNYSFFLQKNTGTILRNINISRIVSLCLVSYLILALEILIISCFLSYLLFINFLPTIIITLIFVVFGLVLYKATKNKLYSWGTLKQDLDAKINQQIIQTFSLIKNVKIFNKEKKMYNFFEKLLFNYENLTLKTDIVQQLPRGVVEILSVISISILIAVLSATGKDGLEILALTAIYAAVAFRLIPSSTRIITAAQRIRNYGPSLNLIKNEFSYLKQDRENITKKIEPLKFENLKFENVSFKYEEKNENTLSDLSLEINKGEVIGIFGESGSGKSTLVNLISGLLKPSNGIIKINSKNLENEKQNWLASLGYVPQQVTLFNDTIESNISFFENLNHDKNLREKLNKVIIEANLENFVKNLPEKENTIVGENAAKLSGGQIQRIGIARALFNNPDFIIFDESTSSLDEKNENEIMQFIYSLKNSKTVLFISHKKEILNNCDKIFEVKNKKILKIK
jgi:ABC-type bacteriocin/lantibiotic exporter with double-glycine peptidase domain